MYRTKNARKQIQHSTYDFLQDLGKIKEALADATVNVKEHVKDRAGEIVNQSLDDVREKSDDIKEFVGDRPYKSLGFALIAGILIGFVATRK